MRTRCYILDHRLVDLLCTKDSLTATWETGVFMTGAPLAIMLRNQSCNVFQQNNTHTSITTKFTDCGTVGLQHDDVIIQENVATVTVGYKNNVIVRPKMTYIYNFSCEFNRRLDVITANRWHLSWFCLMFQLRFTDFELFSSWYNYITFSGYVFLKSRTSRLRSLIIFRTRLYPNIE